MATRPAVPLLRPHVRARKPDRRRVTFIEAQTLRMPPRTRDGGSWRITGELTLDHVGDAEEPGSALRPTLRPNLNRLLRSETEAILATDFHAANLLDGIITPYILWPWKARTRRRACYTKVGRRPRALRQVRGRFTPCVTLQLWWRAWSQTPPPAQLQALLEAVAAGQGLYLYITH